MNKSIKGVAGVFLFLSFLSGCSYFKQPLPSSELTMKEVASESYTVLKHSSLELKEALLSTKAERDAQKSARLSAKAVVKPSVNAK